MARRYAPEQLAWLEENWRRMPNRACAEAFNERFGGGATESSMHSFGTNRHMRKDPGVRGSATRAYTDEENAFLRGFIPGHTEREISGAFEARFGRALTASQVANRKARLGVRSGTHGGRFERGNVPANKGRTWDEQGIPEDTRKRMRSGQFRPGNLPHTTRPLLDTRVSRDGYTEIHVGLHRRERANDQWIPLSHFVWEQANGREWPEGCRAVFADRDPTNLDPENVVPVPSDLYPIVQGAVRGQMPWHDRETLEVAIASARVTQARARLKNGGGK